MFKVKFTTTIKLLLLLYVSPLYLVGFASANADIQKNTYIVGIEKVSYLPYYSAKNIQNRSDNIGYIPELLNLFAKENNIEFIYKAYSIKRLHRNFFVGELDFMYPDNPKWVEEERKKVAIFYSKSIVSIIDGFMVKPENIEKKVTKLGMLRGYTIPSYDDYFESGKIKIFEVNQFESLLKMTIGSRLDAAYVSINPALYLLNKNYKDKTVLVFDNSRPFVSWSHSLSSLKYPDILKKLDLFIKNNKTLIKTLKQKYKIESVKSLPLTL